MKQKKKVQLIFNLSLGFIPTILCMIVNLFISCQGAILVSLILGLVYVAISFLFFRKEIYNFILYLSILSLSILSLSELFSFDLLYRDSLPITLELLTILFTTILFYNQRLFHSIFNRKKRLSLTQIINRSLGLSILSARLAIILCIIHFIIITFSVIVYYPLSESIFFFLFQVLPPLMFVITIAFNQAGMILSNRIVDWNDKLPIVNEQGNVIGKTTTIAALSYKNAYINPVARIVIICNGKLYLCTRKSTSIFEKSKTDVPLECFLRYGETIDQGIKRLVEEAYPIAGTVEANFSIKHLFKSPETNRLVYLYIIHIDNENLLSNKRFKNGKLWNLSQIEDNLGKHYFSSCFEEEYEHLKMVVDIWSTFKK
ncbi:MAG: hypothetical protein RRY36_02950 [Bacteroidaceae bacterium]